MTAENVVKALIQDAAYAFEFDVTTGQLTEDIISSDGDHGYGHRDRSGFSVAYI